MSFLNSLDIVASGLTAQRFRMDIISQNLTNINTTRAENDEPYRRRLVVFQERELNFQSALEKEAYKVSGMYNQSAKVVNGGGVRVEEVIRDESDFVPVYDPSHPDADEDGYVLMPNVDRAEETVDMMAASHSYSTGITVANVIKAMAMKAAELK